MTSIFSRAYSFPLISIFLIPNTAFHHRCGHCKNVAPHFIEVEKVMREDSAEGGNNILLGEVDCTSPGSKRTCKRFNVRGYPSLRLLVRGKMINYQGKREKKEILSFLQQNWNSVDEIEDFIKEQNSKKGTEDHVRDIPEEITFLGDLMDTMNKDMNELYKYKKNALIVAIVFGFILGYIAKSMVGSGNGKEKEA